jgi:hypothetical protein
MAKKAGIEKRIQKSIQKVDNSYAFPPILERKLQNIMLLFPIHFPYNRHFSSTIPIDSTSILIEEEKEEDEVNATIPTDIKKEQFVNASKKQ